MSDNQYVFEIIRDVGYVIQDIKENDTVWFNVKNDGNNFFTARCSGVMPCGLSETSRAIEKAYKVTRNRPDSRDIENALLKKAFIDIRDYKTDAFGDPTTCMEEYMMHVEDVLKEVKDLL